MLTDNLQDLNLLFRCVCCGALGTSDHLKSVNCAKGEIIGRIFLHGRVAISVLADCRSLLRVCGLLGQLHLNLLSKFVGHITNFSRWWPITRLCGE